MTEMVAAGAGSRLPAALAELRSAVAATHLTLDLPGVVNARRLREELVATLDDHVLPRFRRPDAPVLVVVAGPTGAGKSTLVNSLVRSAVSPAGTLRPTTRAAVLACHPDDQGWYVDAHLLSGLRPVRTPSSDPSTVHVVTAPTLPRGVAVVDAPDVDSVVARDRELATRLLAAADVWLFVLTANRYADAVPWQHLHTARDRGAVLVVVLDRVPPEAAQEVYADLTQLLAARGLGGTPVFTITEKALGGGLLDEFDVVTLRGWLHRLGADADVRVPVVRRTLDGALRALPVRTRRLADAVARQQAAVRDLYDDLAGVYADADAALTAALASGELVSGELRVRWIEYVGAGGLEPLAEPPRRGLFRRRTSSAPAAQVGDALESTVAATVSATARVVNTRVRGAWAVRPGGPALAALLGDEPSTVLMDTAAEALRDWASGAGPIFAMIALGGLSVASGDSPEARRLGADPATTSRAEVVRSDLAGRLAAVFAAERDRAVSSCGLGTLLGARPDELRRAAAAVEEALG